MLRALDVLGAFKWPSLLVVAVLPVASYFLDWRDYYQPRALAMYGPETVGGVAALLTHDADSDPLRDAETRWCIRLCHGCAASVERIGIAYGGPQPPALGWAQATPDANAACATLARGDAGSLWLRLVTKHGVAMRSWRLDGAPAGRL